MLEIGNARTNKEPYFQGPPTMKDSMDSGESTRQMEAIRASFALLLLSVTNNLQQTPTTNH